MRAERPEIRITREITLAHEHFLCKFPVLYIFQNPQTIFLKICFDQIISRDLP